MLITIFIEQYRKTNVKTGSKISKYTETKTNIEKLIAKHLNK